MASAIWLSDKGFSSCAAISAIALSTRESVGSVGGAGVRLTTAKFYSPDGHPFSHVGVEPEVRVQTVAKPIDGRITFPVSTGTPDDAFLNAGVQAARQLVVK